MTKWKYSLFFAIIMTISHLGYSQSYLDTLYNYTDTGLIGIYSDFLTIYANNSQILAVGVNHSNDTMPDDIRQKTVLITSIDYTGSISWQQNLHFENLIYAHNFPFGHNLLVTSGNGTSILGSNGSDSLSPNFFAVRPFLYFFNVSGDSLGFTAFPFGYGEESFYLQNLMMDSQHNYITSGQYFNSSIGDSTGIWLGKVNATGNFLWQHRILDTPYVSASIAMATDMSASNDGLHYLVAGMAYASDTVHNTFNTIWKTDTAGNVLWRRYLPKTPDWNADFEAATAYPGLRLCKAVDGSGYYFFTTAYRSCFGDGSYCSIFYCGKIDEEANVIWAKTYDVPPAGLCQSLDMLQKPNGDLLFLGANYRPVLFCTDSTGNLKWCRYNKRYEDCPSPPGNILSSMSLGKDSSIVMGGGVGQDFTSSCLDTAGTLSWLAITDSLGRRGPSDTATIPVTVTDVTPDSGTAVNIITPKQKSRIFPNPAEDYITVSYSGTNAIMILKDMAGKQVLRIPLKNAATAINISMLTPGIYMAIITENTKIAYRQKIVKE